MTGLTLCICNPGVDQHVRSPCILVLKQCTTWLAYCYVVECYCDHIEWQSRAITPLPARGKCIGSAVPGAGAGASSSSSSDSSKTERVALLGAASAHQSPVKRSVLITALITECQLRAHAYTNATSLMKTRHSCQAITFGFLRVWLPGHGILSRQRVPHS